MEKWEEQQGEANLEKRTALGVGTAWRCRPANTHQYLWETSAKNDSILYCPVKVQRDLVVFAILLTFCG